MKKNVNNILFALLYKKLYNGIIMLIKDGNNGY